MSGTKPTPGPWELRGFKIYVPGTEKCIAEARIAWKSSAETAANARLIVRAVNCHADLVAALEEFDAAFGAFHSEMYDRHSTAYRNACNRLAAAVKGARAALAKALEP